MGHPRTPGIDQRRGTSRTVTIVPPAVVVDDGRGRTKTSGAVEMHSEAGESGGEVGGQKEEEQAER